VSGGGGFQEAVVVDQTQRLKSQKLAALEELERVATARVLHAVGSSNCWDGKTHGTKAAPRLPANCAISAISGSQPPA